MWFCKESLNVINLSEGKREEVAGFIQTLSGNNQVIILTHPFFTEDRISLRTPPADQSYREERDCFLAGFQKEGPPIIVLESLSSFCKLSSRLKRLGLQRNIYAFMTLGNEPTPLCAGVVPNFKKLIYRTERLPCNQRKQIWDLFTKPLPRFVELGGEYLCFFDSNDCDNQDPDRDEMIKNLQIALAEPTAGKLLDKDGKELTVVPRHCVGVTAEKLLEKGIDVKLSAPAWPNDLYRNVSHYFG